MFTQHNCSIFAIDFERTCVLTDIKEHSLKPLVTVTPLLFTTIHPISFQPWLTYRAVINDVIVGHVQLAVQRVQGFDS